LQEFKPENERMNMFEKLTRRRTSVATSCLLALALAAASVSTDAAQPAPAAPTAPIAIDPLHPFAGVASAQAWAQRFRTEAKPDPNDRFNNLTAGEWWNRTWNGQWTSAATEGKSFAEFYKGLQGRSGNSVVLKSPYPYASAEAHWNAWKQAAGGGTKHTRATLPDWSGDWDSRTLATGGAIQVRDVWAGVSNEYKPRFAQALQSELEGSHWWPADECLPNGYFRDGWAMRYVMLDEHVMISAEDQPVNEYRVIYHDGRGFVPAELAFPSWFGQSQGFWDRDELVVWVKDIKGWFSGHGLPEYSDDLQIIERWKRLGNEIVVDVTMYDPKAFAFPWHEVVVHSPRKDWKSPPPVHNECVSTNNAYHNTDGRIAEFAVGDPQYNNMFEPRPWAEVFNRTEEAKRAGRLPKATDFMGGTAAK